MGLTIIADAQGKIEETIDRIHLQTNLLNAADQALVAFNADGVFQYMNRAAERLYRLKVGSAMGRTLEDPALVNLLSVQEFKILIRIGVQKNWAGEIRMHRWDNTVFPALVKVLSVQEDGETCIIVAATDISEGKRAKHQLERTIKRLENLRDIDRAILVARSPEAVAEVALKFIRQMVPCNQANIIMVNSDTNEVKVFAQWVAGSPKPALGKYRTLNSARVRGQSNLGNIYVINDIQAQPSSSPLRKVFRRSGIRSFLRIPLVMGEKAIGSLNLAATKPNAFIREYRDIAQEIGTQVAVALHGAQLLTQIEQHSFELAQRVAERTSELQTANERLQHEIQERIQAQAAEHEQRTLAEALRDTAAALTNTLNIEEVLDHILQNVGRVVSHDVAHIMLIDDGIAYVARFHSDSDPQATEALLTRRYPVAHTVNLQRMVETSQPLVITDVCDYPGWVEVWRPLGLRSYVGVPLINNGNVIGFIDLHSKTPGYYTARHAERLHIFANQAAIALDNARQHARSHELAAVEERQRLSHELHDAVSQTLWSACLIADVLPEVWKQDPAEGSKVLVRLRQLMRGSLAELRTLLLELRPSGLTEIGLDTLLIRLAEIISNRTGIPIAPVIEGQIVLPAQVQIGIYRIVQEALTNIIKHAEATQIEMEMHSGVNCLTLTIGDNGKGFTADNVPADHLGLKIMRERALSIDAELDIDSEIGSGTRITIIWPSTPPLKE